VADQTAREVNDRRRCGRRSTVALP
jgi:hypothetical protein